MGRVNLILLDTCTLLWWTLDPAHLSEKASDYCSRINQDGAFISSISIMEIAIKIKKGKLSIGMDISSYVNRLKALGSVEIIAIDENIWFKSVNLSWNNKDIVDRIIVATAMMKKLPIVTKDKVIQDFYDNVIW